jgi:DNA-binding NtrC family response regulator
MADGTVLGGEHLGLIEGSAPLGEMTQNTLQAAEKAAIIEALAAVNGHRKRAAERLGIGERTLYDKLKAYGIR